MEILTGKPLLLSGLNFMYLINVLVNAQLQPEYLYHICQNDNTYTPNSMYLTNLNGILSLLPYVNSGYGFYEESSPGQEPDIANAVALCRGDMKPDMCQSCLNESIDRLREDCPKQREAIVYYDICHLRYSNATILGNNDMNKDVVYMWNVNNASNKEQFNAALRPLMTKLRSEAAAGGSLLKFAIDNTTGPDFARIYGLAQCVPYLSEEQCSTCLESAINRIPSCCDGKVGGRVLTASCNIRYEIYPFANTTGIRPRASPPSQILVRPESGPVPPPPPPPPILERSRPVPPTPGLKSTCRFEIEKSIRAETRRKGWQKLDERDGFAGLKSSG